MNCPYPAKHGLDLVVDTAGYTTAAEPRTFKCGHLREGDNIRRFKNGKWTGERCRACSNADAIKRGAALRAAAAVGRPVAEERIREIVREELARHLTNTGGLPS